MVANEVQHGAAFGQSGLDRMLVKYKLNHSRFFFVVQAMTDFLCKMYGQSKENNMILGTLATHFIFAYLHYTFLQHE